MSSNILVSEAQVGPTRGVTATTADDSGNHVQVQVRFNRGTGPSLALGLLARTVIRVIAESRKAHGGGAV